MARDREETLESESLKYIRLQIADVSSATKRQDLQTLATLSGTSVRNGDVMSFAHAMRGKASMKMLDRCVQRSLLIFRCLREVPDLSFAL